MKSVWWIFSNLLKHLFVNVVGSFSYRLYYVLRCTTFYVSHAYSSVTVEILTFTFIVRTKPILNFNSIIWNNLSVSLIRLSIQDRSHNNFFASIDFRNKTWRMCPYFCRTEPHCFMRLIAQKWRGRRKHVICEVSKFAKTHVGYEIIENFNCNLNIISPKKLFENKINICLICCNLWTFKRLVNCVCKKLHILITLHASVKSIKILDMCALSLIHI